MKHSKDNSSKKDSRIPVEDGKKGKALKPPVQKKDDGSAVVQAVFKKADPYVYGLIVTQISNAVNILKHIVLNKDNDRVREHVIREAKAYLGYYTSRQLDYAVFPAMELMLAYFSKIKPVVWIDKGVDAFAFVHKGDLNNIYLGNQFKDAGYSGKDSVAGVILHEVSHLVLDTEDHGYGDEEVDMLSKKENKSEARANADSWERFFEALIF